MENKIIVVAGPTAVGKTEYAIELAKKYDGEIVSLDSVQVYKYLDIGSAKPSKVELAEIPHYMIDEVEPNINLNVAQFKEMALKYVYDILSRGKMPILVGGTGFYIRALVYNTEFLYEDEKESAKVQLEIENELKEKGIDYIYNELMQVDPDSTSIIKKENERRVIRALKFYKLHNMPISVHNSIEKSKESPFDFDYYVLYADRDVLYKRINERVDSMIDKGLLVEVKNLIDMGLTLDMNSMNSIGYKELYNFCKSRNVIYNKDDLDENSKEELKNNIEMIKQHTRNYAKRQLTWFRSEKKIKWIKKFF